MHKEILTKKQVELLPMVKAFNKDFRLVGGTAIALHIGHRRSIDFDMFSYKPFRNIALRKKIKTFANIDQEIVNQPGEFNEKLFRIQLAYFEDINYAEQVEFMPGFEVPDEIVKKKLTEFSLE